MIDTYTAMCTVKQIQCAVLLFCTRNFFFYPAQKRIYVKTNNDI